MTVRWHDLGFVGYEEALAVQELLHWRRWNGKEQDFVLFQENFPVVTIGRSGSEKHILASRELLAQKGIAMLQVSRGGDVTYHGPAQLVISPILYLKQHVRSVHQYVRLLEQVVINLLAGYGVQAQRLEGASGVWVGDQKIAAIGIAIKHGVTQHGVAINVNPDLSHFNFIVPCGIKDKGITSLKALDAPVASMQRVRDDFIREFSVIFGAQMCESINIEHEVKTDDTAGNRA